MDSTEYIFSKSHILLVEDDEINTYYFLEILKKTRARIFYAKNGKEAIEKVDLFPHIDLILMDIKMPEMNGYEAFDEIRKINKEIPVIAQTAYAMENDKKTIMKYGFNGYLTKPIDKEELFTLLNQFLTNEAVADEEDED